jgi:hypothetical protein
VALGDNTTAGWRGDGITRESQMDSYPVLVARAMGVPFNVPLVEMPGCPPPITDAYTLERLDNDVSCAGMVQPVPDTLHHLAIPGTRIGDILRSPADGPENAMADLMLGGRTILEAVRKARPTFVSIWFGGDEIFETWLAAVSGQARFPYPSEFMPKLEALVDSLEAMGVKGGILIGLPQWPGRYFTSTRVYGDAAQQGLLPPGFQAESTCGNYPTIDFVPFEVHRDLMNRALGGETVLLDCSDNPALLSEMAVRGIGNSNWWFQEYVEYEAEDRGWAFVSGASISEGSIWIMPAPPGSSEPTFGPYFGTDGIYWSAEQHKVAATKIIEAINLHYGTEFTLPE